MYHTAAVVGGHCFVCCCIPGVERSGEFDSLGIGMTSSRVGSRRHTGYERSGNCYCSGYSSTD